MTEILACEPELGGGGAVLAQRRAFQREVASGIERDLGRDLREHEDRLVETIVRTTVLVDVENMKVDRQEGGA